MNAIKEHFDIIDAVRIAKSLTIDYILISKGIETIEKVYKFLKFNY
jgi:hypothetical protein